MKRPILAVDIIIEKDGKIVLIKRKNFPKGWAIPGGFVRYGESVEDAAIREAKEETNLKISSLKLIGVYSNPKRDPRFHVVSIAFSAKGKGKIKAGSDAEEIRLFSISKVPKLVFDHNKIIKDFKLKKKSKKV
jgi:ADP-ribose pyrophosphatase YjhB (NUDIX family)